MLKNYTLIIYINFYTLKKNLLKTNKRWKNTTLKPILINLRRRCKKKYPLNYKEIFLETLTRKCLNKMR